MRSGGRQKRKGCHIVVLMILFLFGFVTAKLNILHYPNGSIKTGNHKWARKLKLLYSMAGQRQNHEHVPQDHCKEHHLRVSNNEVHTETYLADNVGGLV